MPNPNPKAVEAAKTAIAPARLTPNVLVAIAAAEPAIEAEVRKAIEEEHPGESYRQMCARANAAERARERLRSVVAPLLDPKHWNESDTGRVTWLHLDGKTKPWEDVAAAFEEADCG